MSMDDTLNEFTNFFQQNVESSLDLDPWDPIFLSQETVVDKKRRESSVYKPIVEDISSDEMESVSCHD